MKGHGLKDKTQLASKLKKQDPVELPMDDLFFDKLHDKIMAEVEQTEVKPATRWSKAWVFLERKSKMYRPTNNIKSMQILKMGFVGITMALGLSLGLASFKLFNKSNTANFATNKQVIIQQAKLNPQEWIDMAASTQSESDFYADVVNQRLSSLQENDLKL